MDLVAEFAELASDFRLSSLGSRASPSAIPSLRSALTAFGGYSRPQLDIGAAQTSQACGRQSKSSAEMRNRGVWGEGNLYDAQNREQDRLSPPVAMAKEGGDDDRVLIAISATSATIVTD